MAGRKKTGNVFKTISVIIVALLLLALLGGLVFALQGIINGNVFDPNRLVVTVNGNDVNGVVSGYHAGSMAPLDVKINKSNYKVNILSNSAISFDLDVATGNVLSYVAVGDDLTNGFNIEGTDDGFTLVPKGDLSVVLSEAFPNLTIDMDKAVKENNDDLFLLVISSDESTVKIAFGYAAVLTLNATEVSF